MGHLTIVNSQTLEEVLQTGQIQTTGKLGKQWKKTLADLLADLLAARRGDAVFPWVVAEKSAATPNRGFEVRLKVAGGPVFIPGSERPLALPVAKLGTRWSPPLAESAALDLFRRELLWNAIGKKALGRGRSFTHQTEYEDSALENLLAGQAGVVSKTIRVDRRPTKRAVRVTISLREIGLKKDKVYENLGDVDFDAVRWVKGGYFLYEKALEAWLCENIDRRRGGGFWRALGAGSQNVRWFGNYLPFGVQGSSIDLVVLHNARGAPRQAVCTVVELKRGPLSLKQYLLAAEQVRQYGHFMQHALKAYGKKPEMRLVVLSGLPRGKQGNSPGVLLRGPRGRNPDVQWIGYKVMGGSRVKFHRIP